ncbi:MAG TPA: hypothetical protein PLU30_22985 [Verrucomicrobiae bacterium]|nr:hypothetical protein [Verrucomicrobiae bacterium]
MRFARAVFLFFFPCWINAGPAPFTDRFVWVFGWNLRDDAAVADVCRVIETGADHGLNGAVVSFGLDALCRAKEDFLGRVEKVRQVCDRRGVEMIPSVFSLGYGGGVLAHDRNLAEGFPVENAPFLVRGGEARMVPDDSVRMVNGDFEAHEGNRFKGYGFHDGPGVVSFADCAVRHGGACSIRLENFGANPHGHGRVMQEIRVRPHRCYRVQLWVKTEGLEPVGGFAVQVLSGKRTLAPRQFKLPATCDWKPLTSVFNSLDFDSVRIYAGMWGGKAGKLWLDDWSIEEIGPINVLRRPGTPVTVRSEDGKVTFKEGRDYAPLVDPKMSAHRVEADPLPLKILPGGAIRDGQSLRVTWYHPMVIHDSQVTVCMAEPALGEIFDHEAKLLAERVRPRAVLLSMDEVRAGGTCAACRGKDMARLLGECVASQAQAIRRHIPNARVYVWSDMFDPGHNAHGDYYLVEGDFTGSWQYLPKDIIVAVWGGKPRAESLRFFSERGFQTLAACYYDADSLDGVKEWLNLARQIHGVRGLMYTPWQKKYDLLPAFGDLLRGH